MTSIKYTVNKMPKSEDKYLSLMASAELNKVREFHQSFPQYKKTPLVELKDMAKSLGVKNIYVKDESYRFSLNAFKVLGGSYAMAKHISKELGHEEKVLSFAELASDQLREKIGQTTFFTATDGNHGRGVARAARELGQKAVVYMPKGTTETRLENIRKEGAVADILGMNYDDCVRLAAKESAETKNSVVIQDTAWEGYEEIPSWIMQGYGTMVMEATEQLEEMGVKRPTHVFVQAGVGSLAGAVVGYFVNKYPDNPPVFVVVEADVAACLYKSAVAGDGKPRVVDGDMQTIMAGLACGEANIISWDILKNYVDVFTAVSDEVAVKGMRMLAKPVGSDMKIVSGESGAVPFGTLAELLENESYKDLKNFIKLDEESEVLLFSTEGDTDPVRYRECVF